MNNSRPKTVNHYKGISACLEIMRKFLTIQKYVGKCNSRNKWYQSPNTLMICSKARASPSIMGLWEGIICWSMVL